MATIFAGILAVVVYLYDIVVHGATSALHNNHLSKVLDLFTHHNLTLKGEKCIFLQHLLQSLWDSA